MDFCTVKEVSALSLLNSLEDNSIPLIVTDPPYGIGYHSNHYKDKNPHGAVTNDWNFQIGPFLDAAKRVLMEHGAIYLFTRWDVYPLWVSCINNPLKLKNCIIWKKNNWSSGDLTGDFGNQYEMILFITKGRHVRRGYRWSNVWEFDRVPPKKLVHPTQKPVELLKRAIESSSDEGDLILDPYCGSGSTGVAAQELNRKFLLGDVDCEMVKKSKIRLGLSVEEVKCKQEEFIPQCPVLKIEPPKLSLWGIHPEDISVFLNKEQNGEV